MPAATRIYLAVVNGNKRLVRAGHPAAAVAHVARSLVTVSVASQDDIVAAMQAGAKVEDTSQEKLPLLQGAG